MALVWRGGAHFRRALGGTHNAVLARIAFGGSRAYTAASTGRGIDFGVPSAAQVEKFRQDGFVEVPGVITSQFCDAINARIDRCFKGNFDTGNYPDEWYWREEMSLPLVTRHGANFWKSDRLVASVVLSEGISKFAAGLMGFKGTRIGNDSIWVKPPSSPASGVAFHRDTFYVPYSMITCWLTLTDVSEANGTLQYVIGSHKWREAKAIPRDAFHAPGTYLAAAYDAAAKAGVGKDDIKLHSVNLKAGSIVFHHGDMWHGSLPNSTSDRFRRSIGIHLIPNDARFGESDGYIYGRYKKFGSDEMDESFFPVTWRSDGYRSPFIRHHTGGL
eukprot:Opistho-1_new@27534